jgi:hypothetical protein
MFLKTLPATTAAVFGLGTDFDLRRPPAKVRIYMIKDDSN